VGARGIDKEAESPFIRKGQHIRFDLELEFLKYLPV
jgi:hypothetical protein